MGTDGITAAETSGTESEPQKVEDLGQLVSFQFRAPRVGKYDFMLYVLSGTNLGRHKGLRRHSSFSRRQEWGSTIS